MEITGSINMIGYALATLGPAIGVDLRFRDQRHRPSA